MQFEHASGDAPTKMSHTIVEKAINGDISRELQVDILKMHCKVPLYRRYARALISENLFFYVDRRRASSCSALPWPRTRT